MYNWATNTKRLKKNPQAYIKWHLEQMINFGLGDGKISRSLLKEYWSEIIIDPAKRAYLKYLLWGTN